MWALAAGVLALLVRLAFLFGNHRAPPNSDNVFYLQAGHGLYHGEGFPGNFLTPGYSLLIGLLEFLPGRVEDTVTIAQHLLGVALVVAILGAAWRHFGPGTALPAAGIAALTPVLVVHEHTILPDFLFGVLAFAGALALAEVCRREVAPTRLLVLVGVLFGLGTWVKSAGQFLLVATPLALAFSSRALRPTVKGSLVVAGALLVTISPWMVRNTIRFGSPSMSTQGGATLFNRAFEVDRLPIPTDAAYGDLAAQIKARIDPSSGDRLTSIFAQAVQNERGLADDDSWAAERHLALVAIRRHPFDYAGGTLRQLRRHHGDLNRFEGSDALLAELDRTQPPVPRSVVARAWDVARVVSDVWWVVSLNALAGLLLLFVGPPGSRRAAAALLAVWLSINLGTALAHGGMWRYSIQVAPIAWILGSGGIAAFVSAVRAVAAPRLAGYGSRLDRPRCKRHG